MLYTQNRPCPPPLPAPCLAVSASPTKEANSQVERERERERNEPWQEPKWRELLAMLPFLRFLWCMKKSPSRKCSFFFDQIVSKLFQILFCLQHQCMDLELGWA
jgi:hypothetical protein